MKAIFKSAWGYQGDALNLPVANVDDARLFYEKHLGFTLESASDSPVKSVILNRDEIRIGLVENGGDPTQDGCAFEVENVEAAYAEFKTAGLEKELSDVKTENNDGVEWKVYYIVAPDGLCYWVGERQN